MIFTFIIKRDLIVRDVQDSQIDECMQAIQGLQFIVRQPEFPQIYEGQESLSQGPQSVV
jgi:hypothetical protein